MPSTLSVSVFAMPRLNAIGIGIVSPPQVNDPDGVPVDLYAWS